MPDHQRTLVTAAGTTDSPTRHGCPGVHAVAGHEERFVISRQVTDPAVLNALRPHIGVDTHGQPELVGSVPAWVPSILMSLDTLGDFIESTAHQTGDSIFRMEQLPRYEVSSDGDDFHRWAAGHPEPDWDRLQPWLDELAASCSRGVTRRRVRRFGAELTEYERYSCEWGYAHTGAAGEQIRVLRDGEHTIPDLRPADFWVVNDATVVPMHYDGRGGFVGAGILDPDASKEWLCDAEAAWESAEPFDEWWSRHPELRR